MHLSINIYTVGSVRGERLHSGFQFIAQLGPPKYEIFTKALSEEVMLNL